MTTLHLAKQNFKFSAAHFLIFNETEAEKLHGHNYQVKVDIECPDQDEGKGFFVDFNVFKQIIKKRLDVWDEMVLLPKNHPDMKFREEGASLHVHFRDRYYVFPRNEVHLLSLTNTSVENLSKILAQEFFAQFKSYGVTAVSVLVEETAGQGASTRVC